MYDPPNGQEVCRIGYIVHAPSIQLAFQLDGVHEFYDVLSEEIRNKPRVTKHKVVIAKQKFAMSSTNYF